MEKVVASERVLEFYRREMENFIQLGKEFGLKGEKVLEFVGEREEKEREEKRREEEREEKRREEELS